jgi:hypothetical protein
LTSRCAGYAPQAPKACHLIVGRRASMCSSSDHAP